MLAPSDAGPAATASEALALAHPAAGSNLVFLDLDPDTPGIQTAVEAAPAQGIYSVTKAGLIMLTKVMAREMGASGVRVNCICPGVIRTQLSRALWDEEEAANEFLARKALGRFGEVDELVGAAITRSAVRPRPITSHSRSIGTSRPR